MFFQRVCRGAESNTTMGFTVGAALGVGMSCPWLLIKSLDLTYRHPTSEPHELCHRDTLLFYSLSLSLDFQFYICLWIWQEEGVCTVVNVCGLFVCAQRCNCIVEMIDNSTDSFWAVAVKLQPLKNDTSHHSVPQPASLTFSHFSFIAMPIISFGPPFRLFSHFLAVLLFQPRH